MRAFVLSISVLFLFFCVEAKAEKRVLEAGMHHVRRGGPREWAEFPERAENEQYELRFDANPNEAEQSLRVRQQDVKQRWNITLNGNRLGQLRTDENDMALYFAIPAATLRERNNELIIAQDERSKGPDDIRVGEVELDDRPVQSVLNESTLQIEVRRAETNDWTPARITIVTESGALQTVGANSDQHLAVRPGTVYTANGRARFGVPAGRYQVFTGRGFEYSLDSSSIDVAPGAVETHSLTIRREVPTPGYVASDTHVHTLTHSGHGDANIEERMITIAAEGIELPIATDHNAHIDYEPPARALQLDSQFTCVIGNEVTTPVGHFNVFPVHRGARIPNAKLTDWAPLFDEIYRTPGVKAVILNHARDLHSGNRPFGPALHNGAVGEDLRGWVLRANAMEVINSGATKSDPLQLLRDWMVMLNHGRILTPVGSSDSHDVARHFVGQGRTYIRAPDEDPGEIDVEEAVANFVQGRVMVSYGLLAEMRVNEKYGPGELATLPDDTVKIEVRVLGPHWVQANTIELYANGEKIREQALDAAPAGASAIGVKWAGTWQLPRPAHDLHLVAIARGPGVDGLYWKTAKPYQPDSPEWHPQVLGCSGAVWLDADEDGRRTTAFDYAQRLVTKAQDLPVLIKMLDGFDQAVAAQAAHLWQKQGNSLFSGAAEDALKGASGPINSGFQAYREAFRQSERARAEAETR